MRLLIPNNVYTISIEWIIIIFNYVKHAIKTLINVDTYCKKRSRVVTI